jgi:hypothetical protein
MKISDYAEMGRSKAVTKILSALERDNLTATYDEIAAEISLRIEGHDASQEFGTRLNPPQPRVRRILSGVNQGD